MRVFNVRLAAILLGIVAILGVGVYFLHGYQIERNADFFLDESKNAEQQAKKLAKDKDSTQEKKAIRDAINYLSWYVQLKPKNYAEAERLACMLADRSQDGDFMIDRQTFERAYNMLENIVRLSPEQTSARRRLVKMALLLNVRRYQDAKDHLEKYLLPESPRDPELLEQFGQCQAALGEFDRAEEAFKKSIANGPTRLTAYVKLAELLRLKLSKPKEADQWMEKLVKVNPTAYKAHYFLSLYLYGSGGRFDEALEEASQSLKMAPDDADVLLLAATCYMMKKEHDKARDCMTHGIEVYPTNFRMYRLLSDIEVLAGNRDKAVAALQKGAKATDRNPDLLWSLADRLIDANKLADARPLLAELQKTPFPKVRIDYLNARIELAQEHWRLALAGFEDVRGSRALESYYVKQIDFWIALCYRQLGNPEQQELALRHALTVDPSYVPARRALADLRRQRGDFRDTLEDLLDQAKRGTLAPAGWLQLTQLLLVNTIRQNPARRDWKRVEAALDAADKAMPNSPDVLVLRANILLAQDRAAAAETLLLKARDKDPKQAILWRVLTTLAEHEKNWEKAEKLLRESEKVLGDSADQRLAQAQYLVVRGGKDTAERLRKLAENANQFPEEARVQLWAGLLGAALQVGDDEQANSLAQKIAARRPNNIHVRYFIFEKAIAAGDQAAAERALKDIESVAGQGAYWFYGQAILLYMQTKDVKNPGPLLDKALDYLAKARESRKDWSRIPLVEAGVYDRQGKFDLALRSFLEAIDMGERNPDMIQRTVQLLFQSRQFAEADRLLRKLENERRPFPQRMMQASVEIALYLGDADRALQRARKAVSPDSKDYKEQMWLGRVLGALGKQAKDRGKDELAEGLLADAERALRRAAELQPKLPAVWVSLVEFLMLIGQNQRAEAVIPEAESNIPAKDAPLVIARCYEIVNQLNSAQAKYEAALKAAPQDVNVVRVVADFYRRSNKLPLAETLLWKILDGKLETKESDVAWTRQQLAVILLASGKYPDLLKAQDLIQKNLDGPEASPADRRLMARLKAVDPKQGEHEKAIAIFESLIQSQSATPEDRLDLARLHLSAGNWIKASGLLRGLVASNDKDPRFQAFYIDALLRHNEISNAGYYCDRLEKLAPNAFFTVSLKADLSCATNQPRQAFEALRDFVDSAEGQPRDRGLRLRLVAEKLAQLATQLTKPEQASVAAQFVGHAESLLRTFVKESPSRELVLAAFLGEHDKIDEALDILDSSSQTATVEDFAQACSLIAQTGKANTQQMQRMNKIMQPALKKFERPTLLLLALADLLIRQTRFSEAIDVYHEALKKSPDNYFALNNLAVLQSLQGIKLDESLALVNRAIEAAGPLGPMLDSRAVVYIAMKNPDKAIEDMNLSIADQETPVRLFHLAQAYALAGEDERAKTAMERALQKGLIKRSLQPLEWPAFERLRPSR